VSRLDLREHGPSVLVVTLGSAFGVALLQVTGVLGTAIRADDLTGSSGTARVMLGLAATVFIVIATYVGGIVTANTFATIVAGRTRRIALLRLLGATARAQRREVATEGLAVGGIGAALGAAVGTGAGALASGWGMAAGVLPELDYFFFDPAVLLPAGVVLLTTWLASWIGARRVLVVTPMQALGGSVEHTREELTASRSRNAVAIVLLSIGGALLVVGMLTGLVTPLGVLIAMAGGVLSFTGLVQAAHLIMPPALRLVGRMLGISPAARLAAENALRYPERSSRTAIGLVIGITLITMLGVAVASFENLVRLAQAAQPESYVGIGEMLTATVSVFSVLIGFSALIAAVGMANNLSLSVLQRTRELGLLRALGFTVRQVRGMILAESAQLTGAAVLVGVPLGALYGWAGAQAMLGSANGSPGIVAPGVPWLVLGAIVLASALLTWVASVAPSRRATRVSPVAALAVD
jgi:putative ABC transport system permease protein